MTLLDGNLLLFAADVTSPFHAGFALGTAQDHGAVVLTGDPEIRGTRGDWRVKDLRSGR